MPKIKHTPAPWYKRDVREFVCAVDWEICYGQDDECVAEGVYTEADANLIAAAPELLEALKPLANIDLEPDDFDRLPDNQVVYQRAESKITVGDVKRARAAITKAEEEA